MSSSRRVDFTRRNRGPLILVGMAFVTLCLAIGLGLTLGNESGVSAATAPPDAGTAGDVTAGEGSDEIPENSLTVEESGEIRAELEAALLARKTSNLGELREHIHTARELASEAGHDELAGRISNCRSGICYIAQVELSLRRAMKLLDEIPVVDATGSATSTT